MTLWLAFGIGYLLGSIPFGLLLTKAAGAPDVRSIGSGNIGATNVLRTGHKGLALATLVCDALKGTTAVLIARAYGTEQMALLAGFAAFIGHLFPVWLQFKGGKGVATYIGVLLAIFWPGMLIFCTVWLLVAFASRYSSLAALVATALTPAALYLFHLPGPAGLFFAMTLMLWFMHRGNIRRLIAGTEGRIGGA